MSKYNKYVRIPRNEPFKCENEWNYPISFGVDPRPLWLGLRLKYSKIHSKLNYLKPNRMVVCL